MTDDLTTLIPPEWLAAIHAWAPGVVLALVLTTIAVHALLPLARAVEQWALLSAVTWDDGPARRAVEVLEWLASLSVLLLRALPRLAIAGMGAVSQRTAHEREHVRRVPPRDPPSAPPSGGALALLLAAVVIAVLHGATGCGAGAITSARHALAGTARVSAQIDRDLAAERVRVSAEIIARPEATREEHAAAMRFFDEALEVTVEVRRAHFAAESGLDAAEHGAAEAWMPLISCVLSSTAELVGIVSRRVTVPPEAGEVLSMLVALASGVCPEPERESADGGVR